MNLELVKRIYYLEKEIERLESLETSVGGGGAVTLIETQHLAAQGAIITFDNIPSTYTHLLFVGSIRSMIAGETDQTDVSFNGIALPNAAFDSYITYFAGGFGGNSNNTQRLTTGWFNGASSPADMFTPFSFWVFFYADTARYRQVKANTAFGGDKTAPDIEAHTMASCGHWKDSANPVNQVDFEAFGGANNLASGCRISLFGVN